MVTRNEHASRSNCPIACALDLVGDHWTLVIVRDLLLMDRHEFKELLASGEGISTNILSQRLAKLQENGLVAWLAHPQDKKRKLYYLTDSGKDLMDVLMSLSRWASKHRPGDCVLPEDVKAMAAATPTPEAFVAQVRERLTAWERAHGVEG